MSEWVYTGYNSNDIKDKYMSVSKHLLHTWWIHASNCTFLFGFFQFPFLPLGLYRRWASLSCPTPTVTMPTMVESQATWCVPAWLGEERTPARWVWVHVNTYKWVWSHDVKHQSQRRQWNLWRTQIWNMYLFTLLSYCEDQFDLTEFVSRCFHHIEKLAQLKLSEELEYFKVININ